MELLPEHIAKIAISAYRAAGHRVGECCPAGGGGFYRYVIVAPTGEQFVIAVGEVF